MADSGAGLRPLIEKWGRLRAVRTQEAVPACQPTSGSLKSRRSVHSQTGRRIHRVAPQFWRFKITSRYRGLNRKILKFRPPCRFGRIS